MRVYCKANPQPHPRQSGAGAETTWSSTILLRKTRLASGTLPEESGGDEIVQAGRRLPVARIRLWSELVVCLRCGYVQPIKA